VAPIKNLVFFGGFTNARIARPEADKGRLFLVFLKRGNFGMYGNEALRWFVVW